MKLSGIIFFALLASSTVLFAFEDLGKIDVARKEHPEIFIPGSIHAMMVNGKLSYVFMGQSEQCFSGEFAEPESELYEEATLSAKNFLYETLSDGDKAATITVSHCATLYRFNDKKTYSVILFVPKNHVSISKTVKVQRPVVAPAVPEPLSAANKSQPTKTPDTSSKQMSRGVVSENKDTPDGMKIVSQLKDAEMNGTRDLSALERRKKKYVLRLEKDANDPIANFNLGKIYEAENNFTGALKYYQKAVNAVSRDEFFDQQEKVNMILSTAQLWEKLEKNHLALKYYYLLLKCKTSLQVRQQATQKISQIRLKTIE